MVVKVNYNYVAAFLSILVVAAFCAIELLAPASVRADVQAKTKVASDTISNETIKLPVVMYHHFSTKPSSLGTYVLSPEQFEGDLQYIQKCGYTTISADEFLDYVKSGVPIPQKSIMLTIDDGNESVYTYVYPLLKKYKMKAVVSVIGIHTDIFSNPKERQSVVYGHLTWDQLREMQKSGLVEIGNHTYNMHESAKGKRYGVKKLKGETYEQYKNVLWKDVGKFNDEMEKELGIYPTIFAYPFGGYSEETLPILSEMGFRVIFSCEERVNRITPSTTEPVILKRFNRAHKFSSGQFFKKLGVIEDKKIIQKSTK